MGLQVGLSASIRTRACKPSEYAGVADHFSPPTDGRCFWRIADAQHGGDRRPGINESECDTTSSPIFSFVDEPAESAPLPAHLCDLPADGAAVAAPEGPTRVALDSLASSADAGDPFLASSGSATWRHGTGGVALGHALMDAVNAADESGRGMAITEFILSAACSALVCLSFSTPCFFARIDEQHFDRRAQDLLTADPRSITWRRQRPLARVRAILRIKRTAS
jgi:hypothetical protein